jgi:vWA-MoxR associated protein C-terminal domain/vWA-MoxR associated protein middle region 0/Effector-associated domain 2
VTRGNGGALWPLAKALAKLQCMGSAQERNFIVQLLADRLGTVLPIDESPRAQVHVMNMLVVAERRPDGLTTLLNVVREFDEGTTHFREVERIIDERTPLGLWPEAEREELFALLRGVIFPDLLELYRQVAGAGAPELPAETTYREVFYTLETLNADPNGLPKPILFVEHLASGRRSELSIELRRWADRQAVRLGVITELQKVRRDSKGPPPGPPPNSPAYLVLLLRRVGITGDLYQLDHWRQLDLAEGWHPERGEDFTGSLEEIKRQVATLIESVESEWARYQPDIRIEMVLSGDLLNLDVDQWSWEVESIVPAVPIGCRYAFAIRSLERMQTGKWHRQWHARWRALNGQLANGAILPESGRRVEPSDSILALVADFETKTDVVSLMLSKPPDLAPNGGEEIAVGLRAGLPIMVWSRAGCDSEEFLTAAHELLHGDGPGDPLQRAKMIRTTAYQSHAGHVGHHLALLWDDPERLVMPADLGPPPPDPKEASVA